MTKESHIHVNKAVHVPKQKKIDNGNLKDISYTIGHLQAIFVLGPECQDFVLALVCRCRQQLHQHIHEIQCTCA